MKTPHRSGFALLRGLLAALAGFFAQSQPAYALILTGEGNSPVKDPGWPSGALAVANLPTRVSWSEGPPFGGGLWTFCYAGDTRALAACLQAFSGIVATNKTITLREGIHTSPFGRRGGEGAASPVDWTFEVWVPANWERLYQRPPAFLAEDPRFGRPMAGPQLQVWLRPGGPDWSSLQVPPGVVVHDLRATSNGFPKGSGNVISVRVLDPMSVTPPGATVLAKRTSNGEPPAAPGHASPDATGRTLMTGLPEGSYEVTAHAVGFAPRRLEWLSLGTNEFREFTTTLLPAVALEGVVQEADGKPIEGVKVRAQHAVAPDGSGYPMADPDEAVSDSEGRYRLTNLPAGTVRIWAWKEGFYHVQEVQERVRLDEPAAGGAFQHTVRMVATGGLHVRVQDRGGAAKVPTNGDSGSVFIQEAGRTGVGSWGGSARLGPDQAVDFKNVPPGKYLVALTPFEEGRSPAGVVTVEVVARKTVEIALPR